jgi:hypothetical protein
MWGNKVNIVLVGDLSVIFVYGCRTKSLPGRRNVLGVSFVVI